MSLFRSFSNQYAQVVSTTSTVSNASTGVLGASTAAIDFGFQAALLKMVIDASGPAYVQLNGTLASTGSYKLTSADTMTDWYDVGVGITGVSICATSTALSMRVGAWG